MATERQRRIIEWLVIAAAYYTAGRLGQLVAIPPGNITAIWPPSGIALAAVLLRGNRVWPGIVLGAFFASAGAIYDSSTAAAAARSLAVLSGICVGSTFQALLGAALIRVVVGSARPFARSLDVFRFAAIEMLACLVSPTIGVLSMWLGNYIQGAVTGVTWTTWWLGDYTGVLLVTPALLVWRVRPRVRWSRAAEALLLFGTLVVWGWLVFHAGTGQLVLRPYTMIPLLIWAAFRFGRGGVVASALTFSVIAVLGVIYGHGPFVGGTMNESLLALQAFVGVATVTGLAVAAAVEERRRAEVALREAYDDVERRVEERTAQLHASEERFSRSFHASPMGMSITRLADGQYIDVNEAFLSLFGYMREETLGHTSLQLQTWASSEDRDRIIKMLREQGRVRNIEIQYRRKSGEIWTALVSAEVLEIAGERYILALLQDITERKRAEEALRENERRFRALAEALPQLVWTCRPDGPCDYLSRQWIEYTGIPEAEQLGYGWLQQLHPDDRQPTIAFWNEAVGKGAKLFDVEFRIRRADGVYRWFKTRAASICNADGVIMKWFGSNTDIDDLKRAEEELKRAADDLDRSNKELEQFAYVASHDLQEPIRMVSSYTQLLAQRYEGQLDEKAQKYIHYAVDGAIRMQRMINDLLTYSRIGTQGKPFDPTDSHAVLGEALHNLAATIEESRAIITNDDLPTVGADAGQLVLVFQNLLANAIKFRRNDLPHVHVSARDDGREWIFSVKDNGIGIDPQYKDRLFVIFQRLHTRQEYPGTGIGLALCKKIVERHGGRIWVESEPGNGSTFFFTLPK